MDTQLANDENERALKMLTHIEADPDITQLTLADELGVAVGTVNWHLKRLIAKGYVKVKRAQRKKLRYIITPEGIALRASLTIDYIKTSFNLYRLVRERTAACLEELKYQGFTRVKVEGEGEVAEVVELSCIEQGIHLSDSEDVPKITIQGIKLALLLPEESTPDLTNSTVENRGENG